jgi:hypothetical protein
LLHRFAPFVRLLPVGALPLLTVAPAQADRTGFDLAWAAPATCPSEAHVRSEVERQLGRQLEGFSNAVTARATVSNDPADRWRADLTVTLRGQTHSRTIDGDSCSVVADAVALVLAFMIDPEHAASPAMVDVAPPVPAEGQPLAASNEAPASSSLRPAPDTGPTPSTPVPRARPRPWALRLVSGADSAALPAVSGFVALSLRRAFSSISIEGSVAYFFPRSRDVGGTFETRGGKFDLATVGARGCYALVTRGIELSPCLGGEFGTVRGWAFGVDEPSQGKGLWLAATAGGLARWRVAPWFGAVAEGGVALPVFRPEYVIDNVGVVYRSNFIAYRGLVGVEAYF